MSFAPNDQAKAQVPFDHSGLHGLNPHHQDNSSISHVISQDRFNQSRSRQMSFYGNDQVPVNHSVLHGHNRHHEDNQSVSHVQNYNHRPLDDHPERFNRLVSRSMDRAHQDQRSMPWRMSNSILRHRSPPIVQHHVICSPAHKNRSSWHVQKNDRVPAYYYHDTKSVSFPTNFSAQPECSIAVLSDRRPDRSYKDQLGTTLARSGLRSPDHYHPYPRNPHHQMKSRKRFDPMNFPVGPSRNSSLQANDTSNLAQTDRYAPRSQNNCYRPVDSSHVQPRGQWGPSQVTYNEIPRGQWGPGKSVAIRSTQQDPKLTGRQKRNFKIFPRICNPYFPEVNEQHVKPFVLQLNLHPENPFIIRPANLSSHRLVATNNTGSETLFFLEFHPLKTTDPTQTKVVTKLGEIISKLYFMGNNRQDIHPCTMKTGIMRGVGFRPGSDRGSTAGLYFHLFASLFQLQGCSNQ
jgi:hypothetical protein